MYFEDFKEGERYSTQGRTVTETDSVLFSTITGAYNPLFLDEVHASKTNFKTRIVPGLLTASLCTGLIYQLPAAPFGEGFVALVGTTSKWSKPVFHGHTIRAEVTVSERKQLKGGRGLVALNAKVFNQNNEEVMETTYQIVVDCRSKNG